MQTKLHGKISDGIRSKLRLSLMHPRILLSHVCIEIFKDLFIGLHVILIFENFIQAGTLDLAQHPNWIVMQAFPHGTV